MSHPANYVWVEDGRRLTGTGRWGALALPRDVFWGPDTTRALVLSLTEDGGSGAPGPYTELGCEGAVLADADRRRLLLFGGDDLRWERPLQLAFVDMLRVAWAGWRVDWAFGGWPQIAREAGLPVHPALSDESAPPVELPGWRPTQRARVRGADGRYGWEPCSDAWDRPLDDGRLYFDRSEPALFSVLTTSGPGGVVDRPVGEPLTTVLRRGPALLDLLHDHPPIPPAPGLLDADGGAWIDHRTRSLHYWLGQEEPSWLPGALRSAWPGWTPHREDAGLAAQLTRTGRDPAAVTVDPALLRRHLVRTVFDESDVTGRLDLVAGHAGEARGSGARAAPDALRDPRPAVDATTRRRLLATVLAQLDAAGPA